MKKTRFTILTFALTLAIAISAVMSSATVAFAAENNTALESAAVQPRVSVVYPVSGSSSGYFSGLHTSNNPRYGNIPAGTYHINYSYAASGHAGTIVIESDSERIERPLTGDGGSYHTEDFELEGGTYTISIVSSTQGYLIEKYYGYDLILDKEA